MRHLHGPLTASLIGLIAALGLAAGLPLRAEVDGRAALTASARAAAVRGLAFTEKDGANWRVTKKCASCHQGIMTAWTLQEAKERGYPVRAEVLADSFMWCKERFAGVDRPRGTDLNSQVINTAALMFGLMALTNPGQTSLPAAELDRLTVHFTNTQQADGSWGWSALPAGNRPPPVSESDEVATLMAYLALEGRLPADRKQDSPAKAVREKAAGWLASHPAGESTQAAVLRWYASVRDDAPKKQREAALTALLARQNADGGWSQVRDLPSDAFATGQVLYFLHLSGLKTSRPEIRKGIGFLVASQREDGSWKVTPRAQPGAKPFTHPEPIESFGTAWATMALMRLVPPSD